MLDLEVDDFFGLLEAACSTGKVRIYMLVRPLLCDRLLFMLPCNVSNANADFALECGALALLTVEFGLTSNPEDLILLSLFS